MNNSDRGFVLGLVPYREHDAMVHFLGYKTGLIRLVLPGYYKSTSKQSSLGLEFSYVEYRFDYHEGRLNRIRGGELIDGNIISRQSFEWLLWMSFVSEVLIRTYDEAHHEVYFEHYLQALKMDNILFFIVKIIAMQGFSPDVNGCVVCGDSGINAFSVELGGFVCQVHANHVREDREFLIALNSALRLLVIKEEFNFSVIERLVEFLEFHGEYRFNSWKLLKDM